MARVNKVVLAYSGGLDTSVIIPWLKENYGASVIAMASDVGQKEELDELEDKALASGADKLVIRDVVEDFVTGFALPTLQAGAVYEGKYLLGTAMARPLIARCLVEVAEEEGADAVAHGCTGKGNDQVRFELTVKALAPQLSIIAPWREWEITSREDAMAYARERGIPVPVTEDKPYSMDRNLWHISYEGGILEDPDAEPPADMFLLTNNPDQAPDRAEYVDIQFDRGVPVAVNGREMEPVPLVEELNELAGKHGVGRVDIVENRLVGMKSRGVYETPGGTLLWHAHRELESLCLDRETQRFKEMVSSKYAELVYYGLWYTRLREALDAFVQETQQYVTGTARLKLYRGNVVIAGRQAERSLYDPELATFGPDQVYNQADAEGFINLFGLPVTVEGMLRRSGK